MVFYTSEGAPTLAEDGMMSPPVIDQAVFARHNLAPLADGSRVEVWFKGAGPAGFSLVYSRFEAHFQLPRHSHSADCLYYVLSGDIVMGNRVMKAGDGFFIRADAIYAYAAGDDGAEVLEFRAATNFDMKIADQTAERWQPIVDAAAANHAAWLAAAAARTAE
jgi:hypothetical protein